MRDAHVGRAQRLDPVGAGPAGGKDLADAAQGDEGLCRSSVVIAAWSLGDGVLPAAPAERASRPCGERVGVRGAVCRESEPLTRRACAPSASRET